MFLKFPFRFTNYINRPHPLSLVYTVNPNKQVRECVTLLDL